VTLLRGKFYVEDIPDHYVTWAEVAREAYGPGQLPGNLDKGLETTAYWEPRAYTYPYSANVAAWTGSSTLPRLHQEHGE